MSNLLSCLKTQIKPYESPIAEEKLLEGSPVEAIESLYESTDQKFFVGYWSSTPGKWRVTYEEEEYFEFLSGEAIITGEDGEVMHVSAGDKTVIKAGFSGTWETVKACRKLYVISLK